MRGKNSLHYFLTKNWPVYDKKVHLWILSMKESGMQEKAG